MRVPFPNDHKKEKAEQKAIRKRLSGEPGSAREEKIFFKTPQKRVVGITAKGFTNGCFWRSAAQTRLEKYFQISSSKKLFYVSIVSIFAQKLKNKRNRLWLIRA